MSARRTNSQGLFIRGSHNLRPQHRGNVVTIGAFDGVHKGHQAVLAQVCEQAHALGLPSMALIFEPQPNEYFLHLRPQTRDQVPARLMRLGEKVEALFAAGIDRVLCLPFNEKLRRLSAEAFLQNILIDGLGVRYLVVGDDFRFGHDRSGDFRFLADAGQRQGFTVCDTATCEVAGERVSSTRIRQALEDDDLALAAKLLGRPYFISGRVVEGRQMGRQIGVPTANVQLKRYRSPLTGVYAVEVEVGGQLLPGAANVGIRPTFDAGPVPVLEIHILNFNRDIYRQRIKAHFRAKIRAEEKFASVEALTGQIHRDLDRARQLLGVAG